MNMTSKTLRTLCVCLLAPIAILTVSGCGSEFPMAPVTGTITRTGEPVANAIVEFFPAEGRVSVSRTNENGFFTLMQGDLPGAVIGPCRIQVTPQPEAAPAADGEDTVGGPMTAPPTAIRVTEPIMIVSGENFVELDVSKYEKKKRRTGPRGPRAM